MGGQCIAYIAYYWISGMLNNVHVERDGDFSQAEKIKHTGALLIGTLDRFTYGDPSGFSEISMTISRQHGRTS